MASEGSWFFVTHHPVACVIIMTFIVGIVIYKIITFHFTEEQREQREPREQREQREQRELKDTEYVLNFVNIFSLCYVRLFNIFSAWSKVRLHQIASFLQVKLRRCLILCNCIPF